MGEVEIQYLAPEFDPEAQYHRLDNISTDDSFDSHKIKEAHDLMQQYLASTICSLGNVSSVMYVSFTLIEIGTAY